VLGDAIGGLLPSALAVAISPFPIIAVVLVLGGPGARSAGPAFAAGWVAGLTVVSAVVVLVLSGDSEAEETGVDWVTIAIGLLFWVLAAKQWSKRPRAGEEAVTPGWMGAIGAASPPRAALIGAAMSGANVKNLALTVAASAAIGEAGLDSTDTVIAVAAFVVLGSVTVLGPVLFKLAAPARAARPLAAVRQFMAANNAVILMVILLVLGAKLLGDGLAGVWD
jgi:hypothetical protein